MSPLRLCATPSLGLLGAPVVETGESGLKGVHGTLVPSVSFPSTMSVAWYPAAVSPSGHLVTGITHGTALDLQKPFGRFAAYLWLHSRSAAKPWMLDATGPLTPDQSAAVLACSVRRDLAGLPPVRDVVESWRPYSKDCWSRSSLIERNLRARVAGPLAESWTTGWEMLFAPANSRVSSVVRGIAFGEAGKLAADQSLLAVGLALLNPDGTIVCPEIAP